MPCFWSHWIVLICGYHIYGLSDGWLFQIVYFSCDSISVTVKLAFARVAVTTRNSSLSVAGVLWKTKGWLKRKKHSSFSEIIHFVDQSIFRPFRHLNCQTVSGKFAYPFSHLLARALDVAPSPPSCFPRRFCPGAETKCVGQISLQHAACSPVSFWLRETLNS